MVKAPAVQAQISDLPFHAPGFTWQAFEGFCRDFLNSKPDLISEAGVEDQIVKAEPVAVHGAPQHGMDIAATMASGEKWVFQCKHREHWQPNETERAVKKALQTTADRYFLIVSCEINLQAHRQKLGAFMNWHILDSTSLRRLTLNADCIDPLRAASLLTRNFGRDWSNRILGRSSDDGLLGAEAYFESLLREDLAFDHLAPFMENEQASRIFAALDDFVASPKRFALFFGEAGVAKSRLLFEWSARRRRAGVSDGSRVAFACQWLDSPEQIASGIDLAGANVIVLDDAHRHPGVRRSVVSAARLRPELKVVFATRPINDSTIRQEIVDEQFVPSSDLQQLEHLRKWQKSEIDQLVDRLFGDRISKVDRVRIRMMADGSPLVVVLAARAMENDGRLDTSRLEETEAFRDHLFDRLLPQDERLEEFAQLLALLAPSNISKDSRERYAKFLETSAVSINQRLETLSEGGCLEWRGDEVLFSLEILSDHLVYRACWGKRGRSLGFAERVYDAFPDRMAALIRSLSYAEWRAKEMNPNCESVISPIWIEFKKRFLEQDPVARASSISTWRDAARMYAPAESLELARLALSTRPPQTPIDRDPFLTELLRRVDPPDPLDRIPSLLEPVAVAWPEYTQRCLEIVWDLVFGPVATEKTGKNGSETLKAIVGVTRPKSPDVVREALTWAERQVRIGNWHSERMSPQMFLRSVLLPVFEVNTQTSWSEENHLMVSQGLLAVESTAEFREKALEILQEIGLKGNPRECVAALAVLESALDSLAAFGAVPTKSWSLELGKARLRVVNAIEANAARRLEMPIQLQIYRMSVSHGVPGYGRDESRRWKEVRDAIPDTLALRVFRCATSAVGLDEFDHEMQPADFERSSKLRNEFQSGVAAELIGEYPEPSRLVEYLERVCRELEECDYSPNIRGLAGKLSAESSSLGRQLVRCVIDGETPTLRHALPTFIHSSTVHDPMERLRLIRSAIEAGDASRLGGMRALTWWRGDDPAMSEDAWILLQEAARRASPLEARVIFDCVELSHRNRVRRDWDIVAAVPEGAIGQDLCPSVVRLSRRFADEMKGSEPHVIEMLLSKSMKLSRNSQEVTYCFPEVAKWYPAEMFLFLDAWFSVNRPEWFTFLENHPLNLSGAIEDPRVTRRLVELEESALNGKLLQSRAGLSIFSSVVFSKNPTAIGKFIALVDRTSTETEIENLIRVVNLQLGRGITREYPEIARRLLTRAREFGAAFYEESLQHLSSSTGIERSSTNGEPEESWTLAIDSLRSLSVTNADDPVLAPLYRRALQAEESRIHEHVKSYLKGHKPD